VSSDYSAIIAPTSMKRLIASYALVAYFFLLTISEADAQKAKFGSIDESELKMKVFDKDTSAVAVVLSDFGSSRFIFTSQVQLVFERHTRIKILKKSGYIWADVDIPYYQKENNKEKVTAIKGFTYNLDNGKVTKNKLEPKSSFETQHSENWFSKTFTMPNVKEGSVIEFSYIVTSDFIYNLKDWEFQKSVPTVWSEYQAVIPEYYDYKFIQQGFHKIHTPTELGLTHRINEEGYRWIAKDLPALKEEKYITTLQDYVTKIKFELEQVKYPGQAAKTMTGSWEQVVKDLLENQYFGRQISRNNSFKEDIAAITALREDPENQLQAIFKLVQNRMNWNGKYALYANSSVKRAFEERKGNVAEINLLLTAMLNEAGFDASPVLVSTRSHGKPYKGTPLLNEFNYIISHVNIGVKDYLLDATDPMLPAGMLPERILNGEGYLVKAKDARWINLSPTGVFAKSIFLDVNIAADGSLNGKGFESVGGYNALRLRETVKSEGKSKYLNDLSRESGYIKVSNHSILNLEELDKSVNITFEVKSKGNDVNNAILYLDPILGFGGRENPFKLSERYYPVDFGASYDETIVCNYIIPAGWVLDEIPQSLKLNLPNNGGSFIYMAQQTGDRLQVMSKLLLSKAVYHPSEYSYLKEFFDRVVAKHAEKIVLKKSSSN
jgi:hypothetical protein